jgi:hypothetical protein
MVHCFGRVNRKPLNYETQIFHHAKIPSSKNPLKEIKIIPDIITLKLISSFNTSQNIIFQKSSCKNRPIMQGPKSLKLLYSIMIQNTISVPYLVGKANKVCFFLWVCSKWILASLEDNLDGGCGSLWVHMGKNFELKIKALPLLSLFLSLSKRNV